MKLTVNLAGASREELIELTGRLISIIESQEARIAELEGQQVGPPQERTQEARPRLCPAAGGANTSGGARHGQLP